MEAVGGVLSFTDAAASHLLAIQTKRAFARAG